jgi:hypothetical protein
MEHITGAAVADSGVLGRDGELPWPSIPADNHQYRERITDSPVILGRRSFDPMRDDLPGCLQVRLSRSSAAFDVETAHHAAGGDDAVETLEDSAPSAPPSSAAPASTSRSNPTSTGWCSAGSRASTRATCHSRRGFGTTGPWGQHRLR